MIGPLQDIDKANFQVLSVYRSPDLTEGEIFYIQRRVKCFVDTGVGTLGLVISSVGPLCLFGTG